MMETAAERDRRGDDGENDEDAHNFPSDRVLAPELMTRDFGHLTASGLEKR